jgi:hypothetical protein
MEIHRSNRHIVGATWYTSNAPNYIPNSSIVIVIFGRLYDGSLTVTVPDSNGNDKGIQVDRCGTQTVNCWTLLTEGYPNSTTAIPSTMDQVVVIVVIIIIVVVVVVIVFDAGHRYCRWPQRRWRQRRRK